jgi:hypothetical protein
LDSFDDDMWQSARKKESSKQPKKESRQKQSAYKAEESPFLSYIFRGKVGQYFDDPRA